MFKQHFSVEKLQAMNKNTIGEQLGIEFVELGENHIIARMPVDNRTHQPFGILHGGASVVLAETLGSVASVMMLENLQTHRAVGLEINANHIRPVSSGWVYGKATPIHLGRTTHLWEIRITNEDEKLVCISRLTVAVVEVK